MNLKKFFPYFLVAIFLALASTLVVQAEISQNHYTTLRGTVPGKSQDAISSVTTHVWTTAINPKATLGNPSVAAYVSGSSTGATADLAVGLYFKNSDDTYTFLGIVSKQTVTLSATTEKDGSSFVGLTVPTWDTRGAPYYDLRVLTISAGSVTVRQWGYGAQSQY